MKNLLTYPARRFWEEHDTNEGKDGEEDLQGNGEAELGFARIVGEAIVYMAGMLATDQNHRNRPYTPTQ